LPVIEVALVPASAVVNQTIRIAGSIEVRAVLPMR
jgi:hypothetical protein